MATDRICVTAWSQSKSSLCKQNACQKHLGIWPACPIVIDYHDYLNITPGDEDNIVAALDSEHLDRVCFCWASHSWVAVGKDCKDDAGAIFGSRTSSNFLGVWNRTSPARCILGQKHIF